MPLADLAQSPGSFVLLAPPAVGKSEALKALREREQDGVDIAPESRTADGLEQALRQVMGSRRPLYLDALDQAALYVPQLFRVLERLMISEAGRQTRWRLACRPAAWDARLATLLDREFDTFGQFRLLPLDREAAQDLVTDEVAEPQRFLDLLSGRPLRGLLSTPGRLLAVARDWSETGRFPTGARDTIELELRHLLADHDEHRPSDVSDDDRRRATQRLAAFHVLSGARRFRSTGTTSAGVTVATSLPTAPEPDRPGQPVGPEVYRAALDGPLFVPASGSTVTFEHQPHAEYLAATYLINRGVGRKRFHRLLGLGPARVLPSSLAGLAAWVATLQPDVIDDLLEANALVLMQSAAELPTDESREAVVTGLLNGAQRGEHHPDWQVQLTSLSHPDLTTQLVHALDRPNRSPELVWWVAKLAVGGGCRDLTDALAGLADDDRFPDHARTACIEAVGLLGTAAQRRRLQSFLELEPADDRDDEMLAATIKALYPDELTTAELLRVLRPQQRKNFIGNYASLLTQLGSMIPDDDLPAALAWLAALAHENPDEFDDFNQLPGELVRRAWDAARDANASLADMLAQLEDMPRWAMRSGRWNLPWTTPEHAARRRTLAVDVAARLGSPDRADALLDLRLIHKDDVTWLLDELPTLATPARGVLARAVPWLAYEPPAAVAERVLGLQEDHPAHGPTRHLRGACTLDGPEAARGRQRAESEFEAGNHLVSRDEHRRRIMEALEIAEQDPSQWGQAAYELADPNDWVEEALFPDLAARSGWSLLSQEDQTSLLEIGLTFVATHTPDPDGWRGRRSISEHAVAHEWGGVWLLTTLLRHDPARLDQIAGNSWRRQAPALVGAWDIGGADTGAGLRGALIERAPTEIYPALATAALEQLDADIRNDRGTTSLHMLDGLLPLLGPRLVELLLQDKSDETPTDELVAFLAEGVNRVPSVIEWLHQLRDEASDKVARAARLQLATIDPRSVVDVILDPDSEEAERRNLICRLDFPQLGDTQLERLATLLLKRYPGEEGPHESEVARGDPMLTIEHVRWRVLQHVAERGMVETLESSARDRAGDDRRMLRYLAGQARRHQANQALSPIPPQALLDLLERNDARLVRSDVDLLNVVIEQLETIQHLIHHGGAARFLWNDIAGEARSLKPENDITLWVKQQLASAISGALVDRELEVTPSQTGTGTRVDLTATAPTATSRAGTARVLIEAKRYDNAKVLTALETQLANRYLIPESRTAGIYLVYWVDPNQRPAGRRGRTSHSDVTELRAALEHQAQALPTALIVRPVVIDVSPDRPRVDQGGR